MVSYATYSPVLIQEITERIQASALIQTEWYEYTYRGLIPNGMSPITHFLQSSPDEGYNPNPLFDIRWYMKKYALQMSSGICPLIDFIINGVAELRNPHPFFDTEWYLRKMPELSNSAMDPLTHYFMVGSKARVSPFSLFDPDWYLQNEKDVAFSGMDPLEHFATYGDYEGRSPHCLFQPEYYASQLSVDSPPSDGYLRHYLESESKLCLNPHPLFASKWFLNKYKKENITENPLVHFLKSWPNQYLDPNPLLDLERYVSTNSTITVSGMNPLSYLVIADQKKSEILEGYISQVNLGIKPTHATSITSPDNRELFNELEISKSFCNYHAVKSNVLVSVIMPTGLTDRALLKRALDSVCRQSYSNFEVILGPDVENCSDSEFCPHDARIKMLLPVGRRGVSFQRNRCVRASRGNLIAYLDDDNTYHPDMLEIMVKTFEGTEAGAAYSQQIRFNGKTRSLLSRPYDREELLKANFIDQNSLVHRREFYFIAGGFDENLERLVDWDFVLRLSRCTEIRAVEFPGSFYNDDARPQRISIREDLCTALRQVFIKHVLSPDTFCLQSRMNPDELALLSRHAEGCQDAIEFGAGGSTALLLRLIGGKLFSIESDSNWIELVRISIPTEEHRKLRWKYSVIDIGPVLDWGFPADDSARKNWPDYANSIWASGVPSEPDLVIIDGRFRVACALLASSMSCRPKIFIHDFWTRPYYHIILDFCEIVESAGDAVVLRSSQAWDNRFLEEFLYDPR